MVVRTFASCVGSIALGGIFGAVAAIGMGAGFMAELGFFFGAIVGLLCSPALISGLRYGPWLLGLVLIAAPTTLVAYIGGRLTPPNGGPLVSMGLAVAVYISASLVRGAIGKRRYGPPPPGVCEHCRYDRTGLAAGAVCPECGAASPIA